MRKSESGAARRFPKALDPRLRGDDEGERQNTWCPVITDGSQVENHGT